MPIDQELQDIIKTAREMGCDSSSILDATLSENPLEDISALIDKQQASAVEGSLAEPLSQMSISEKVGSGAGGNKRQEEGKEGSDILPPPPAQRATRPSESVVSVARFDRVKHQDHLEYRLKSSSDRAPSPFNGTDGDHRTAIGYIKEGFVSLLQGLRLDTKDGVDSLKNEKRDQLYDYISAVAAMDTPERGQELFEGINKALEDYNVVRLKKEQIDSLRDQDNPTNREVISKLREINASQTLGSLSEIHRVFMTFVNQMPNSYVKIPQREAPTNEGSKVDQANSFFTSGLTDDDIGASQQQLVESEQKLSRATARQKTSLTEELEVKRNQHKRLILDTSIERLSDTFFYLEIPQDLIGQHRSSTLDRPNADNPPRLKDMFNQDGIRESYIRNNSTKDLTSAIAHHLNITFVRYPELLQQGFSRDEVSDRFTDHVINGQHEIKNNNKAAGDTRKDIAIRGWPELAQSQDLVERVKNDVKYQLTALHTSLFVNQEQRDGSQQHKKGNLHYTSNPRYESVVSSRGSAARSKANSGADAGDLGLVEEAVRILTLDNYESEGLLEELSNRLGGEGAIEEDKNALFHIERKIGLKRRQEEGEREFDKEGVRNVLVDLIGILQEQEEMNSKKFLKELNSIFKDELGIKYPIDRILESDNYVSTLTEAIEKIEKRDGSTITKNELVGVVASSLTKQDINLETKEESFVERLGLEERTEPRSFVEAARAGRFGNIGSKDGYQEL